MAASKQHTLTFSRNKAVFRVSRELRAVEVIIPSPQAGQLAIRQQLTYDPLDAGMVQANLEAIARGDLALPFVEMSAGAKTKWAAVFDATIDEVFANIGVVEA